MVSIIKTTFVLFILSLLSTGEARLSKSEYYEDESIKEAEMDYNKDSIIPSAAMEYNEDSDTPSEAMEHNEDSDTPSEAMEHNNEVPSKEPGLDELEQMTDEYSQEQKDCTQEYENLQAELSKCEEGKEEESRYLLTEANNLCDNIKKIQDRLRICEKPATCEEVQINHKKTGDYILHVNGKEEEVRCVMEEKCGTAGPWTLRKHYQLQASEKCPREFATRRRSGVRICTKNERGCRSVKLSSLGIKYSKVCGMVTGYQSGSPDAFRIVRAKNVRGNYVDGVSITQGSGRKHIWTYAAGINENYRVESGCPCNEGNTRKAPWFVRNSFYCESAYKHGIFHPTTFNVFDKLWDGHKFRGGERKCYKRAMPWFYRSLRASTDYIEVRICTNEHTWNENVGIGEYEFYTK